MATARIGGYRFISLVESFSKVYAPDFRRTVAAATFQPPDGGCGLWSRHTNRFDPSLSLREIRRLTGQWPPLFGAAGVGYSSMLDSAMRDPHSAIIATFANHTMATARVCGHRFISLVESFSKVYAPDFRRTVAATAFQPPDGDCDFWSHRTNRFDPSLILRENQEA